MTTWRAVLFLPLLLAGCAKQTARPRANAIATTTPAPSPASYRHDLRHDPNESIHIVTIDLSDPRVQVNVSRGGADPDGDGPWTTTLLPVREIAEREGFDIAVNGDFFSVTTEKLPGMGAGFVRGKWANPAGPAETDGKLWKPAPSTRPALLIGNRKAGVANVDPKKPFPDWVTQAIGGNVILVRDGKPVNHADTARHPRTVAGVDRDGTHLFLLVVDGRQKDLSIGMTYAELSREMLATGAWNAVNLDGGGSTTLVMRDPQSKKLKVINSPSDGKERAVADVVGVKIKGPLPTTRPAE